MMLFMVLNGPSSMALGFQWTEYCPWDVGILNPCLLLADLLPASYLVNAVVELKHMVHNSECPRLQCKVLKPFV